MTKKAIFLSLGVFVLMFPKFIYGQTEEGAAELFCKGEAAFQQRDYKKALSYFEGALEKCEKLGLSKHKLSVLGELSSVSSFLYQKERALVYAKNALRIAEELKNPEDMVKALNNIATIYAGSGQYNEALLWYGKAKEITSKEQVDFYTSAVTLENTGVIYMHLDKYDKALSCFEESLKIYKTVVNSDGFQGICTSLLNKAQLYIKTGQYAQANSSCEKLLKMFRSLTAINKQVDPSLMIAALQTSGVGYIYLDQYDKALSCFGEALKIGRDTGISGADSIDDIGYVYFLQGKYKEAEENFKEANKERGNDNYSPLPEIHLVKKEYDKAILSLEKVRPQWNKPGSSHMQFYTLRGLALKGRGILKESCSDLLQAVSLTEQIRQQVKERDGFFSAGLMFGGFIRPYKTLTATLCERTLKKDLPDAQFSAYGKDLASSAFYFSELTKARVLLEALAQAARKRDAQELPTQLQIKEQELLNQLSAIEDTWEDAFKKGEEAFKQLTQRKESLNKEFDSLVSQIRKDYPKYASLNYPQPIPAEQLPLKDNEALLEYVICDDSAYLFKLRKGASVEIIKIPKTKKEIEALVKEFCLPFERDFNTQSIPYENFSISQGKNLYDLLLSGALINLPSDTKIIIIPDGILGRLPFEALVVDSGTNLQQTSFVIDKWAITYYQSAAVLALSRSLQASKASKPLFALGNPIYSKDDLRYGAYKQKTQLQALQAKDDNRSGYRGLATCAEWGKTTESDKNAQEISFNPLPETEGEIKSIARLFNNKPQPPDILLGIFANETGMRNTKLNQYRLLHFATHADLPGKVQGINEPFILLGQVENNAQDDGFLTLTETLNLKLDADMVVLSACKTARGKAMDGEGLLNFARAFHYAGARTVVVSLWEVASEQTVEYMKLLYQHIKEGKSKSEAFSLAKRQIKQRYPNPFFWSAFIMHGEG